MGKHGKPAEKTRYLTVRIPGHPLAQKDGRLRVHRAILWEKIGPGPHPCHWCGNVLEWDRIVTDHVNGVTWDNRPDNLVPACNGCNLGRHSKCKWGHEFTPENTYIRANGTRMCRACERDRARVEPVDAGRPPGVSPKRVALTISAGNLTLGQLREYVAQTADHDGDVTVYIAHEFRAG